MSDSRQPGSSSRRAFLRGLSLLTLGSAAGLGRAAQSRDVVVVTSYPDELVSRFEAGFEQANPGYRLRVVWRAAHDALPTLRQPAGIDVYWSPSPRNFALLKREGRLRRLDIDRTGLPGRLGNTWIDDPDGYYAAFEVAGYGFAVHPGYLKQHGLPEPTDWADLADGRYAGHLVVPNPGKVGFAPPLADIPLQAYGWERGWAMWSAVAANAALAESGGNFVGDELAMGRRGIGPSIDFFVAGAIARGAPLRFVYPRHGGVNPAQAAIMAGAGNVDGARAFVSYLLSAAGQKLLVHPDIRRLPVRPAAYAGLEAGYYDPFAAAEAGGYGYDSHRGLGRLPVVAALFDTVLAGRQADLARLWAAARRTEGAKGDEARRLLALVPLDEAGADRGEVQQVFARRDEDEAAKAAALVLEQAWAADRDQRFVRVAELVAA